MKTLVLSIDDVRHIVRHVGLDEIMDQMIDRLTRAIKEYNEEKTLVRTREGFHYRRPHLGLLEWMPIMNLEGQATVKVVGYHPTNPGLRQLPTILSTISAYDTTTGHLVGLADGTFMTAIRTGAASAVASRILAVPEAGVLGLIGCGAQAITQLHALSRVFSLREVLIYDVEPAECTRFTDRVARLGLDHIHIAPTPLDRLVAASDILCTATSVGIGDGPLFEELEMKPWVHINAAGSDFPGKVELPLALLQRSFVCPDIRSQAMLEGECQQLEPEEVGPSLLELVQQQDRYPHVQRQVTVFDSTGWVLEDQVAMGLLLEYATALKLGTLVPIECISADPKDPYDFLSHGVSVPAVDSRAASGRR
jgi:ornithine cyclodeaminase/alanine dehydrogenase-like protein (mu-crystallin family)